MTYYEGSDTQSTLLYFLGVVAVCLCNALALAFAANNSNTAATSLAYEHNYRGFKWGRCAGYAALVVLQLPLFAARLAYHGFEFSWIDAAQCLVLVLYLSSLVSCFM